MRFLRVVLVRTTASLLCALVMLTNAHARASEPAPQVFDIGPQSLASALSEFARQSQQELLFAPQVVANKRSGGVHGAMVPLAALQILLKDSQLAISSTPNGAILIGTPGSAAVTASARSAQEGKTASSGTFQLAQANPGGAAGPATVAASGNAAAPQREAVQLEEIVVSAEKREARLTEVPVPVTALKADTLLNSNRLRLQDYYASVPGLSLATSVESAQLVSIRGVTTGGTTNPTVGIVVDDVPFGASTELGGGQVIPDIDPGDLARIEVLRGPQGTLYGASSMGGLLKFVTVDPSTQAFSGRAQAGVSAVHNGNSTGYDVRAAVNVPLTDTLAVRISGFTRNDPGYIDNPVLNIDGLNRTRTSGGRLSALWRIADGLSVKLSALYQESKADGSSDVDVQPGLGDLQQNYLPGIGGYDRKVQAYSATLNAALGDAQLTAITGYNVNSHTDSWDFTYRLGNFTDALFGVTGTPITAANTTNKFSEEVRLTMPLGSSLDWLLGAFYTHESSHYAENILAADPLTGAQVGIWGTTSFPTTFTEYAGFTDLTYRFTDRFDVQFGGRESVIRQSSSESNIGDAYDINFLGLPSPVFYPEVDTKNTAFTYLVTPRFKISPDTMLYARLASGYRAGGPNVAPGVPTKYKPDKTENYELGFKGNFLYDLLSVDASLYYINWKDIQISLYDQQVAQSYNANGSGARSRGFELTVESRPLRGLELSAWVSFNDAALTRAFPATASAFGAEGDRLPYSSRFSGNFSVQQDFPIAGEWTGFVGGTLSYVGSREGVFLATPQRQYLPAYAKTDVRAGAKYDTWTVNLFANNVADRRGLISGGLGNFPPFGFNIIQPRLVGLSVVKTF